MTSNIFKAIFSLVCIVLVVVTSRNAIKYKKLRNLYGKKTGAQMFKGIIRSFKPIVPALGSKRYKTTVLLLDSVGWRIGVEYFYLVKMGLSGLCLAILFVISLSNQSIQVRDILTNINFGRVITSAQLEDTENARQLENMIFEQLTKMTNEGIIHDTTDAEAVVQRIISMSGTDTKESVEEITQRILMKIDVINSINDNANSYLSILILSILAFHIPDTLAYVKMCLLENSKTWDSIYCMVIYSIFGRIPPYRVDTVLSNMEQVAEFYQPKLTEFRQLLNKNSPEELQQFLKGIHNDDLQEVLEMLCIANRTGLLDTVDDVDDLYENALTWMDISNKKRRQLKFSMCLIPLSIIFFLLILYFQYGLTSLMNTSIII